MESESWKSYKEAAFVETMEDWKKSGTAMKREIKPLIFIVFDVELLCLIMI